MVAACYNAVMLPKRTSFLGHEKEIALQLPQQLFFAPLSPQAFQPQIVADKRIGKAYFCIGVGLLPLGAKIGNQGLPKLRIGFRSGYSGKEGVILAGFCHMPFVYQPSVLTYCVVSKKPPLKD